MEIWNDLLIVILCNINACICISIKTYSKGTKLVVLRDIYLDLLGLFAINIIHMVIYENVTLIEFLTPMQWSFFSVACFRDIIKTVFRGFLFPKSLPTYVHRNQYITNPQDYQDYILYIKLGRKYSFLAYLWFNNSILVDLQFECSDACSCVQPVM